MKIRLSIILFIVITACTPKNKSAKVSTAAENLIILPKFTVPYLNRERTVRLYLPPSYQDSDKRYPVLYMHDGQNLFDAATSFAGEWKVDETLNKLAEEKGLELIVVGIDNGREKRMNELSPWPNKEFGDAEGEQYMQFVVEVVKPYIDKHYRSLSDRDNTAIMGSSMGGLISHYAIHQYPHVFSKAGIFSPSYWFSSEVQTFTKKNIVPKDSRLYLIVGSKEGEVMVSGMQAMVDQLVRQGHSEQAVYRQVVAGAEHNEGFWADTFPHAIQWLFQVH